MKVFDTNLKDLKQYWMRLSLSDGIRFGFGLFIGYILASYLLKGIFVFIMFIVEIFITILLGVQINSNSMFL